MAFLKGFLEISRLVSREKEGRKNQESRLGSFLFIPSKLPFFIKYSNPLHFTLDLTFMEFTSFASYRRFNPGSFLHILFLLLAF